MKTYKMKRPVMGMLIVAFLLAGVVEQAEATIIVAGIPFDDNAFADVVLGTSGNPDFERIVGPTAFDRVPTTAEDALLGSDLASMTIELTSSQSVTVGFTDNAVLNDTGYDLIIFEEFSTPEGGTVQVEVDGTQRFEAAVSLGMFDVLPGVSNYINVAYIDLSDYGFAPGQTTQYVKIFGSNSEFAVFGAFNNIPEPATVCLLGLGGLSLIRRKRK